MILFVAVKRDREESLKRKSQSKAVDVMTNSKDASSEEKGENKEKRQHIIPITCGTSQENSQLKGILKRKIAKLMFIKK